MNHPPLPVLRGVFSFDKFIRFSFGYGGSRKGT